jgi:hypothetical protein
VLAAALHSRRVHELPDGPASPVAAEPDGTAGGAEDARAPVCVLLLLAGLDGDRRGLLGGCPLRFGQRPIMR